MLKLQFKPEYVHLVGCIFVPVTAVNYASGSTAKLKVGLLLCIPHTEVADEMTLIKFTYVLSSK